MEPTVLPINIGDDSEKIAAVRSALKTKIVGQPDAIDALMDLLEKFKANIQDRGRPIGSCLFLGPTGTGKTRLAEVLSEELFGTTVAMLKVDCGEFQHSHQIAKLLGSPPGYLGHRETPALITAARLLQWHNDNWPISIILFDEFDKASDALWHLMLGILDKGQLTLGCNEVVDFSKTIVIFTSNTGSREMAEATGDRLGFNSGTVTVNDAEIRTIGMDAAKRKYTPEFINRLDRIVTFNTLKDEDLTQIVDIELGVVQTTVFLNANPLFFTRASMRAKEQLLKDGRDPKYNGRGIRRAIERAVVLPLSRMINQKLVNDGDAVVIDYVDGKYTFGRIPSVDPPKAKRVSKPKTITPKAVVPCPLLPGFTEEKRRYNDKESCDSGGTMPKDYHC